jgi:hypothetical protein
MGELAKVYKHRGGLPSSVALDLEGVVQEVANVEFGDAPDVSGGGTETEGTLQILDFKNDPLAGEFVIELNVFSDTDLVTPSANGKVLAADVPVGTFLAGANTNSAVIKTNANGQMSFKITHIGGARPATDWLSCSPHFGSRVVDCRDKDSVTWTA